MEQVGLGEAAVRTPERGPERAVLTWPPLEHLGKENVVPETQRR